jgi:hypothetical protein
MVGRLGERLGNQTSYQFCEANLDLGTPRGGRRTVPMRRPSFFARGVPSLTMRMGMSYLLAPNFGSSVFSLVFWSFVLPLAPTTQKIIPGGLEDNSKNDEQEHLGVIKSG